MGQSDRVQACSMALGTGQIGATSGRDQLSNSRRHVETTDSCSQWQGLSEMANKWCTSACHSEYVDHCFLL